MAYLKSTSIDGDLSVTGGITVSDTGLIRESSGSDFYLGTSTVLPSRTDLNNIVDPGIYILSHSLTYINCPYSSENDCRMEVKESQLGTLYQTIYSPDGLYYRYIYLEDNVFPPWQLLKGVEDTGWNYVTLSSAVVPYRSNEAYTPRYRKIGNLVQVIGILSPSSNTNNIGSSAGVTIFTMPTGYRPVMQLVSLFQGTSTAFFTITINPTGVTTLHRYRNENGYVTPTTDVWMPFHFEYFTDQ